MGGGFKRAASFFLFIIGLFGDANRGAVDGFGAATAQRHVRIAIRAEGLRMWQNDLVFVYLESLFTKMLESTRERFRFDI